MSWDKLALLLFLFALAGYFLWCWRDGRKSGVITIKFATVSREHDPRGFEYVRSLCLVAGVGMGSLALYVLATQP